MSDKFDRGQTALTTSLLRVTESQWLRRWWTRAYTQADRPIPRTIAVCAFFWTAVITAAMAGLKATLGGPKVFGFTLPVLPLAGLTAFTGFAAWQWSDGDVLATCSIAAVGLYLYAVFPVLRRRLEKSNQVVFYGLPRVSFRGLRQRQVIALLPGIVTWSALLLIVVSPLFLFVLGLEAYDWLYRRLHIFDEQSADSDRYRRRNWAAVVLVVSAIVGGFGTAVYGVIHDSPATAGPGAALVVLGLFAGFSMGYRCERYVWRRDIILNLTPEVIGCINAGEGPKAAKLRRTLGHPLQLNMSAEDMLRLNHIELVAAAISEVTAKNDKPRSGVLTLIGGLLAAIKANVCPITETDELILH